MKKKISTAEQEEKNENKTTENYYKNELETLIIKNNSKNNALNKLLTQLNLDAEKALKNNKKQ